MGVAWFFFFKSDSPGNCRLCCEVYQMTTMCKHNKNNNSFTPAYFIQTSIIRTINSIQSKTANPVLKCNIVVGLRQAMTCLSQIICECQTFLYADKWLCHDYYFFNTIIVYDKILKNKDRSSSKAFKMDWLNGP